LSLSTTASAEVSPATTVRSPSSSACTRLRRCSWPSPSKSLSPLPARYVLDHGAISVQPDRGRALDGGQRGPQRHRREHQGGRHGEQAEPGELTVLQRFTNSNERPDSGWNRCVTCTKSGYFPPAASRGSRLFG
jgi:hypothetical protein